MSLTEFEAGLENLRKAIIASLQEIGVTLLPGEISHHPIDPANLPAEIRLSLAPKGAAFVTGTFTREEIEAIARRASETEVLGKVATLTHKYAERQKSG
jgi:hypothetical protein